MIRQMEIEEQVDTNVIDDEESLIVFNTLKSLINEKDLFTIKAEELLRTFDTEIYKCEVTILEKEANRLKSDRIRFINYLTKTHNIVLRKEQSDNNIIPIVLDNGDDRPYIYRVLSTDACNFAITFFSNAGPRELFNLYTTSVFMKNIITENISELIRGIINNYCIQEISVLIREQVNQIKRLLDLYDSCIKKNIDPLVPYVPCLLLLCYKFIELIRSKDRGYEKVELFRFSGILNSSVFVFNPKNMTIQPISTLNLFKTNYYQNVLDKVSNRIQLQKTTSIENFASRNYVNLFNYNELVAMDLKPIEYYKTIDKRDIFIIKNGKLKQLNVTNLILFHINDVLLECTNSILPFQSELYNCNVLDYYTYRLSIIQHIIDNKNGQSTMNMNNFMRQNTTYKEELEKTLDQYIKFLYDVFFIAKPDVIITHNEL